MRTNQNFANFARNGEEVFEIMSSGGSGRFKQHPLIVFFVLAFAISWAVMIPLALTAQGIGGFSIPPSIHYLAAYGPMLAALITTGLTEGASGLREIFTRMVKWRVRPVWWLVAFLPLVAYALIAVVLRFVQGEWLGFGLLGRVDYLPDLGLGALALWILTFGIGEEVGWRGYALPWLQANRGALPATVILWVFWALWHLPAYFYLYNPAFAVGIVLGQLAGAITFTWLYNSADGSILIVAVWHGMFNFTTGCTACKAGLISAVLSTLVMVWAVVVVIVFKPANLSRASRQTA